MPAAKGHTKRGPEGASEAVRRRRGACARSAVALAVTGLAVTGCALRGAVPTAEPGERPLTILVVGELRGTLEPCGCTSHPRGGVYRLGHVAKRAARRSSGVLVLGLGDLLYENESAAARGAQERAKAETLVAALERVGLAVSVRGALDSGDEATTAKWRWLEPGRPGAVGRASFIKEVGGVRVAVVAARPEGAATAREQVAAARAKGAAVIVVVVRGDREGARRLLRGVPGVDFAFAAESAEASDVPERVGGAVLLEVGTLGQELGVLELTLPAPGRAVEDGEPAREARVIAAVRFAKARRRLALARKDGEAREMIAFQKGLRDEARAALRRAEKELAAQRPKGRNVFRWRALPIDRDVPEDGALLALRDRYKKRLRELNLRDAGRLRAPVRTAADVAYVGNATCGACHGGALAFWKKTPHGRAFATLQRVLSDYDLGCVGCHTTGYLKPGGSSLSERPELRDVGCEVCHGPGGAHVAAPPEAKRRHIVRAPGEAVCKGCHTPEHSDLFDFAKYRARILGPGHGAAPTAGGAP